MEWIASRPTVPGTRLPLWAAAAIVFAPLAGCSLAPVQGTDAHQQAAPRILTAQDLHRAWKEGYEKGLAAGERLQARRDQAKDAATAAADGPVTVRVDAPVIAEAAPVPVPAPPPEPPIVTDPPPKPSDYVFVGRAVAVGSAP